MRFVVVGFLSVGLLGNHAHADALSAHQSALDQQAAIRDFQRARAIYEDQQERRAIKMNKPTNPRRLSTNEKLAARKPFADATRYKGRTAKVKTTLKKPGIYRSGLAGGSILNQIQTVPPIVGSAEPIAE